MTEQQRRHIWEVLPIFGIGVALVVFMIYAAVDYGDNARCLTMMNAPWTLSGTAVERLPARDVRGAGEKSELSIVLGEEFARARAICFYTVYEEVQVRLDGETVYSFVKPRGERLTAAAPCYWNQLELPAGSAGRTLTVTLSTPYQQYANMIPEFRSGEASRVARFVQMKTVPPFVAALAILFLGLVFSLVAVFMRYYEIGSEGLYSLSLFVVVLAIFLAAQQTNILLEIFSGSSYILIQHAAFMLCPVMYTRYLMRSNRGFKKKVAFGLNVVSIANLLLILSLQLLRVRDMPQMMSSTRNLMAITVIYVFVLEMRQHRRILICLFGLLMIYSTYRYFAYGAVSWLIYLGIFAYLYLMVYRIISSVVRAKTKEIRLEAALEVSKSEIATIQITSHFFYHTLDSIRALIRIDANKAYKMTGDFAKYIRYRVDGVERLEETVGFSRELRAIRAYTDIKQAQLGERFKMIFDVDTEDFEILPLTVQPLVENAVIHAVQKRREGGMVRLVCRETASGYHIEVIDNGPGAAAEPTVEDRQKRSTAIVNVNTRLEFYGVAPLKFESNELGGMSVSLDLPKNIVRKGNA